MPIFDVEANGERFQIEAPDETSAVSALASLPAGPTAPENSLSGSAKALGVGAAEGVIGLAGLPGDAADLASRGFDYMTGNNTNETVGPYAKKFGSENIKKLVEGYTGAFRKPQTVTEKYLQTIGQFAPAAIGGPAGALGRVATRAVIPGVASEAAGQLTEGTPIEPYARIAGALGGAVAGGRLGAALSKPKIAAVPTIDETTAATKSLYTHPEVTKLEINAGVPARWADEIKAGIASGTITEGTGPIPKFMAPQAFKAIDTLKEPSRVKQVVAAAELPPAGSEISAATYKQITGPKVPPPNIARIADIDGTRKLLGTIAGEVGPTGRPTPNALVAIRAIKAIDVKLSKLSQGDVITGDAAAASKILNDARAAAAAGFRSERVMQAIEKAKNTASATHSGANLENEIYKQVRNMLANPAKNLRGWSAEEKAALKAVLPGRAANVLRRSGKLMGGGGGLGQLISGGAGAAMFGWPGMMAVPALGMGANKIGSSLAMGRINKVSEMLRARSPLYGKTNQAAYMQSLQGGGILGSLPSKQQAALLTLLAARPQPSN